MNWLKRKWTVAKQNPLFWCNIALIFLVYVVFRYGYPLWGIADLHLRLLGTFLELVGVGTVWYDLSRSAAEVGREGAVKRTLKWLGVLLLDRPQRVSAGLHINTSRVLAPRVLQRTKINKAASLEERLDVVEQNLTHVDQDLDSAINQITKVSRDLAIGLAKEGSTREAQVGAVSRKLAEVAAGSYAMLLFGVAWLSVGLIISGFSEEIFRLKTHLGF